MFDHTKMKVYFRDKFVDFKDANISVGNTGFLYGLGIFSGMRAHYNKEEGQLYLFDPKDHYKRLLSAAKMCSFNDFMANYSYEKFEGLLKDLLKNNDIKEDAYIRFTIFVDEEKIGPKFGEYKDSVIAFLYPLGDYVPTGGMKCKVSSWTRVSDNALSPRAKFHGAYVNTALAKTEALAAGFDEVIVLDREGHVIEGSAENIFIIRDGVLITPPVSDDILEGITRRTVLQIAKDEGIEVCERSIDRTELYFADEIFLSGTGAKVSPVTQVDHVKIGDGSIGPIGSKIQDIYFKLVKGEIKKYKHLLLPVYEK